MNASGKTTSFAPPDAASPISRTALSTQASVSNGTDPAWTTATVTALSLAGEVICSLHAAGSATLVDSPKPAHDVEQELRILRRHGIVHAHRSAPGAGQLRREHRGFS